MDHDAYSREHSKGWNLLMVDDGKHASPTQIDSTILDPDLNAPPPTAEECIWMPKTIARVVRFYTEGADKQDEQKNYIQKQKEQFEKSKLRVLEQLEDIKQRNDSLPKKKELEEQLNKELRFINIEINARTRANQKLDELFRKRAEITKSMEFLQNRLIKHCSQFNKDNL